MRFKHEVDPEVIRAVDRIADKLAKSVDRLSASFDNVIERMKRGVVVVKWDTTGEDE